MLIFKSDALHRTSNQMETLQQADIIPADLAKTLAGLLIERVRRSPDAAAYVQFDPASRRWVKHTWRETAQAIGRWQQALCREGMDQGDRIAVLMANRREWVHFDIAALGLGLVVVPLYTNDRPENVRHILEDSGARLLLLDTAERLQQLAPIAPTLKELNRVLVLESGEAAITDPMPATAAADWLETEDAEPIDLAGNGDSLATIVYTSGTTGPPKGVMLTHRNILWNAEAVMRVIPGLPSDRFLSFLPLSHALERTGGYYLPMMAGASVYYARSIPQLAEDLITVRPTILIAVPRIFERVHSRVREKLTTGPRLARALFNLALEVGSRHYEYDQGRTGWSPNLLLAPLLDHLVGAKVRARMGGALRVAVSGGAPISPDIARFFLSLGVPLVQGYGLTEASPVVTLNPLDDNLPHSIGIPLPDLEVRIGADDELCVRSPGVMLGYWNQPSASDSVLDSAGWLRTGDQVRMDDAGHVFITGRIKDIIVLANGEKVPPADLEIAIANDELVAQVLVIGEGRPYLTALVALDTEAYALVAEGDGLDPDLAVERSSPRLEAMVLERINKHLEGFPGYAEIHRVAIVEQPWSINNGTMTPTMKLKRAFILEHRKDDLGRLYAGHV